MFRSKYRIQSARLSGWDYSTPGYYFVTICSKQRDTVFGDIVENDMHLSRAGEIVTEEWLRSAVVRNNVELDEWVVMPDHIHGILSITHDLPLKNPVQPSTKSDAITYAASQKWKANTLGSILNQFKGKCTKRIRNTVDPAFAWQARFHDRIIQSEKELNAIRHYIRANPENWHTDQIKGAGLFR